MQLNGQFSMQMSTHWTAIEQPLFIYHFHCKCINKG
jgi:hypothetical protein